MQLYATIGGKRWPLETYRQASEAYLRLLTQVGPFHPVPKCHIEDEAGQIVAHVSLTGRVWPGREMTLSARPLYDPRGR